MRDLLADPALHPKAFLPLVHPLGVGTAGQHRLRVPRLAIYVTTRGRTVVWVLWQNHQQRHPERPNYLHPFNPFPPTVNIERLIPHVTRMEAQQEMDL